MGPRRVQAEVRRQEILDAAQACFRERGFHRTTVDDVARRAGLSKGAIYWHFKGKREVFFALFDRYMETFALYGEAAEGASSAADALRRMGGVLQAGEAETMEFVELHLEYIAHASRDEEIAARYRQMYETLRAVLQEQVERGIREGDFRAVDPAPVTAAVMATLDGLILQKVFIPGVDLGRLWEEGIEIIIRGISA